MTVLTIGMQGRHMYVAIQDSDGSQDVSIRGIYPIFRKKDVDPMTNSRLWGFSALGSWKILKSITLPGGSYCSR